MQISDVRSLNSDKSEFSSFNFYIDFTKCFKIGSKRQQWLADAGIFTFSEIILAQKVGVENGADFKLG